MSQQNQASFLLQAIGENYIMKTYAKGGRKNEKEASCGDLKCSSWYDHDTGYLYGSGI